MKKIISVFIILLFSIQVVNAASLGNKIIKDEYPDSNMVAPHVNNTNDSYVIKGGVENVVDVNLDDCLRFALGNNPKIQAAIQDVFASDYRIKEAWSNWFPSVSWQTGGSKMKQLQYSSMFGRNMTFNYYLLGTISVSEMLYDFGVTQNQVTVRKLENKGYKMTLVETINSVICDVKGAYYNVLYTKEQEKVAADMVSKYEKFYEQAKAFYEAGTNPKVDVTMAQVNLSSAKLSLIEAENAVDISMAKLNNAMGLPYTNKYTTPDKLRYNPCDITLDEAVGIAKESRPDFKLADVKVETQRQNVQLTKKAWLPKLELQGDYSVGGKSFADNYGYTIGGFLNFPTINGMLINNQIKEAKAVQSKEVAIAQGTKNDIYLEIQNAYYGLVEKKNKIPVASLQVKQAKENYDLSFGRYKVGVGDPVELKDAQTQYSNARLQYNSTLFEYNLARANMEKAIGKNIVSGEIILKKQPKKDDSEIQKVKLNKSEVIKTTIPETVDSNEIEKVLNIKKKQKNEKMISKIIKKPVNEPEHKHFDLFSIFKRQK